MKRLLTCPRCGSGRLARLAKNDISPFRGYRCESCQRRLRDPGSLVSYLVVLVLGLFFTAAMLADFDQPGIVPDVGRTVVFVTIGLVCVGYAAIEIARPAPRTTRPVTSVPANEWYFARNGVRVGPFTDDQMRQMAATGTLSSTDMVLDVRTGRWASAGIVAELFPAAPDADPDRRA